MNNDWAFETDLNLHKDKRPMIEEFDFVTAVRDGDVDFVRENCENHRFMNQDGVGELSPNPLTNLKYHFVVTAALICRICVTRGLDAEVSYRMSDYYIRRMDEARTVEKVEEIHNQMVLDYTGKMKLLNRFGNPSKSINDAISYICRNIFEPIGLEEVADAIGMSPSHLSKQFSKEVGLSISDFIRERKLEKAAHFLKYSEYSFVDIANKLSFSSQSHFIQKFKEYYGVTPKKYREDNFMRDWSGLGAIDQLPASARVFYAVEKNS